MTKLLAALLAPLLLAPTSDEVDAGFEPALETVTDQDVRTHVDLLTRDVYAGRDTPQPGMVKACEYVAEQFSRYGLVPVGADDSFLVPYALNVRDVSPSTTFVLAGAQGDELATLREEFVPAKASPSGTAEGDVVFCGYGIEERKYRWNSFKRVDVRGKIVVVLAREPRADDDNPRFFDGLEATEASSLSEKVKKAAELGAVGVVVSPATAEESGVWMNAQLPILAGRGGGRRGGPSELALPTVVVTLDLAERILGRSPTELRDRIDGRRKPDSFDVDARIRLDLVVTEESRPVPQVAARYPGRDQELLGEVVVVGAHLDHVGMDDRGRVYNGADDNAGGVAGLLEVAQAFGEGKPSTRRSVVFIAFTGEERGLLGSYAWCREPPIAMSKHYGMINLDIISRGRKNAIEATPPPDKTFFDRLLSKAVKESNCRLKVGRGGKEYFQRSDQYPFHREGIPTVFFNEGKTNEDYHQPSDTADKLIEEKVAKVARLSFTLAYLAANSDLAGGLR
ncbi:MAG: M20/M25/M40 family metallo-hydrolase [Planctomycetota bacterium JB042]